MDRIVAVAGVPAPLGPALVRSFALAGDDVVAAAPSGGPARRAAGLATDLRAEGARVVAVPAGGAADAAVAPVGPEGTAAGNPAGIATAYGAVRDAFGRVDVLVAGWRCRAGAPAADGEAARGVESRRSAPTRGASAGDAGGRLPRPGAVERAWRASAEAGYQWACEAAPDLRTVGGTLLFVGPAPVGGGVKSRRSRARDPATAGAAAATRGLARALAARLGPDGVRVAHVGLAVNDVTGEADGGASGHTGDGETGDVDSGDPVGVPAANGVCGDPAATAGAVRRVLRRADWSPAVAVVPGEDGPAVVDVGEGPRGTTAAGEGAPDRETPF